MYSYITITVPNDKLPSLNLMLGGHFSSKSHARKRMEKFFRRRIIATHPPTFREVVITYECFRNSFLDEDNLYGGVAKICNDALVNIGVLATDKFPQLHTVVLPQRKCRKDQKRIVITIRPQPTEESFREFISNVSDLSVMWKPTKAKPVRGSIRSGVQKKRSTRKTLFSRSG